MPSKIAFPRAGSPGAVALWEVAAIDRRNATTVNAWKSENVLDQLAEIASQSRRLANPRLTDAKQGLIAWIRMNLFNADGTWNSRRVYIRTLVRKPETIRRELGSLSPVLERRIEDMLAEGLKPLMATSLEMLDAGAFGRKAIDEELESDRKRKVQLVEELKSLGD